MDKVVAQVVLKRVQPPEGIVDRMGYPRQGMPVVSVKLEKRPAEQVKVECADMDVARDIIRVVPIDKAILKRHEIHNKGDYRNNPGKEEPVIMLIH